MANPISINPSSGFVIAGIFSVTPPTLVDGQGCALQTDSAGNLKVTFTGGSASNPAASPTGAAVPASADYQGINIGGILTGVTGLALGATTKAPTVAIVDGSGNQITSFGGGTQFADNAASGATPTGTLSMGWDSVNSKIRALKVDASQNLNVNVQAIGTVTVTGAVDVTDRAARLVGVVYGSQGQQLKQTATNFNAQVELATGATLYDARQIRALTAADVVTANAGSGTFATSDAHLPTAVALSDALANPTTTEIGANLLGWDATNSVWRRVQVDAATGTLKVDGSGSTQPVSGTVNIGTMPAVDVTDRAARLLGVVYGSQGQQLKQTATNFNLQVELATGGTLYDARQIRALTSADVVSAAQSGLWNVNQAIGVAGFEKITDGTNTAAVKAASTAPVAADPALVVAISPNTPTLPVSIAATVNVSVQNATLAVTQSTSPWVENVSQFGGNPVVTGTGISGAGIPRVTISSDSFPATQSVVGPDATNKLSVTNPVQMGGVDGSGIVRQLALDDAGNLAGNHQDSQTTIKYLNAILQALNNLNFQVGAMPSQVS